MSEGLHEDEEACTSGSNDPVAEASDACPIRYFEKQVLYRCCLISLNNFLQNIGGRFPVFTPKNMKQYCSGMPFQDKFLPGELGGYKRSALAAALDANGFRLGEALEFGKPAPSMVAGYMICHRWHWSTLVFTNGSYYHVDSLCEQPIEVCCCIYLLQ